MKDIKVLLIKFIACALAFTIGLDLVFEATIVDILSFSLVVTAFTYLIGERIVLPYFGNVATTIIDFIIAYTSVWIFGTILLHSYLQIAWGSIISAGLITGAEVFVHRYVLTHAPEVRQKRERQKAVFNGKLAYGTEVAEEPDVHDKDKLN
ncbi:YndM family protein [Bacillus sp. CGMCC 1.16541]|uniref:YndM family protein n=1 Tax=Bacillus sp. CGMCC 1.16541 TaxID=2185143 RepID=UPI000D73931E|nr:YndM family protein [Bacillus sp. CGMCC 1.16541]